MNSIIYLLVALGSILLAIQNGRNFRTYTATGSFVLLCALSAVGFGSFGLHLLSAGVFGWVYPIAVSLMPAALLSFLVRWLEIKEHKTDNILWALGLSVGVVYLVLKMQTEYSAPNIGAPEYLISVWFLGSCAFGMYWLWNLVARDWERHRKVRLQQLLGLIISSVVALLLEGWMRLLMPDFNLQDITHREQIAFLQGPLPPIGAPLSMLSLYVLHLNVKLTRLISLQELFSRMLTHALTALVMTVLVGLALMLDGDRSAHTGFQIWLIALFFVTFFDGIHDTIGKISTHVLNRQGSDFQDYLHEIERALSHNLDLESLDNTLLYNIHDAGRTEMVSMYRWNQDTNLFDMSKCLGHGTPIASIQANALLEHFRYGKHIHRVRSSSPSRFTAPPAPVVEALEQMHIDICFPLWADGMVVGWMGLKLEQFSGGFTQLELDAVQQLTQRVSLLIETIDAIENIKETHRLQSLGTMASGLAKELTHPLQSLEHSLQYLKEDALPDEVPLYVDSMSTEVSKLHRWLQDFSIYASPLVPVLDAVDINQSLQSCVDSLDTPKEITCIWDLLTTLPTIEADPGLIHHVWHQLLTNAIESMDTVGTLNITTKLGKCRTGTLQGQPAIEVRIADTGQGMDAEVKRKVFIPFFSTKRDGDGIGLAMVERIIKAHNAEIQVRSAPNEGSTFIVRLPIWNAGG